MCKKKTHEYFIKEVYALVGDEYKVLDEYINSKNKVKILHTKCGNEYKTFPNHFLSGHRCPFCFGGHIKTKELFIKEVYDLVGDEYKVLGEYYGNKTKIKILHIKCGNEYEVQPVGFLHGNRCPFCCHSPQQVKVGFNSMWDTNHELAKLLLNPEDGYKYTQCSHAKVDWKCPYCGQIVNSAIFSVNKRGLSCPKCGDSISYPNRLMFSLLSYLNVEFENEKSFKWCKFFLNGKNYTGRYDFYFLHNNQEYVVEMDGGFHFCDNKMTGKTKEDSNQIDLEKDRLAIKHNILPIRINCEKSELEYIKTEILKSNLNSIFDLSNIDWQECNKQSLTSLKLQACELWKEHHSTKIISEIMKKGQCTIRRWLKSCATDGLSDYVTNYKVVCISTDETFNSITIASKKYNVKASSISACCKDKANSAGKLPDGTKLRWEYIN